MDGNLPLTPFTFQIDSIPDEHFAGYADGRDWNGWAYPYFTFEVALHIADSFRLLQAARYDEQPDEFVFGDEDEEERFGAVEIEGRKLYPIGAGSWIWEKVD